MSLIIGTRASDLALAQTHIVIQELRARDPNLRVTVRPMRTEGDRRTRASLAEIGGTGVFVKELEAALQRREIDVAVHSLKDIPPRLAPGLCLTAVLPRDDARDVLVSRRRSEGLHRLASGSLIGTGSPRREVQLRALRSDLEFRDVRGNVPRRLKKLDDGQYDALILAAAGLKRLGLADRVTEFFEADAMVPAVGQGVLAIETRTDAPLLCTVIAELDDPDTRAAITAERSFLFRLGAGCSMPVAAYARREGEELVIRGMIARDNHSVARLSLPGPVAEAEKLGIRLAEMLMDTVGEHLPNQVAHV